MQIVILVESKSSADIDYQYIRSFIKKNYPSQDRHVKLIHINLNSKTRLEASQKQIEDKMSRMQQVIDNIEKDIYDEGFDFEITCPYCNYEFFIDVDENRTEVECPECKNMIELDWSGDVDDEPDGCNGDCHGCSGCGDEDDDM